MNLGNQFMHGHYDSALVALSVLIAVMAAYAALDFAGRITAANGIARAFWLAGGATALGTGIWSMHYIGMLAFHLPVPVMYDWPTVLLSLLAAIFASLVALWVVSRPKLKLPLATLGSMVMGSGIASMHYTGMMAMRLAADCIYSPELVALSILLAIVISFAAIYLVFRYHGDRAGKVWRKYASALVMGSAIPVMHYTAMAAAHFVPTDVQPDISHAVPVSTLGITGVMIVTFMVLGLSILTIFVDRRFQTHGLQLEASENRYRQLVESAQVVLWEWNLADSCFSFVSHEAENTLGFTTDYWLKDHMFWENHIPPEDFAQFRAAFDQAAAGSAHSTVRHRLRTAHGELKWVRSTMNMNTNPDGSPELVGVLTDLTERHFAEEELLRLKESAEAASKAKSNFLSTISHELRTPLNAIIGYAELLQEELSTAKPEQVRADLQKIEDAGEHLLNLIQEILDFSKIEAGKMNFTIAEFDISKMISSIAEMTEPLVAKNRNRLVLNIPAELGEMVSDEQRLKQALLNLMSNAAKFTEGGRIELGVRRETNAEIDGCRFWVTDTGMGMNPETIETLFQPFSQADGSRARRFGGTGLGLTICRRLIHSLGGEIYVESNLGKGSSFTVLVPVSIKQEVPLV